VPLDAQGYFFEPLWTNFRLGQDTGILDWYTILVGVTAYFALAQHGALWVAHKTEGDVSNRARHIVKIVWWAVAGLTAIVTVVTFQVQPQVLANLTNRPWGFIFPALAVAGLIGIIISISGAASRKNESRAFFASCAYLLGMLTSVVFGLYPYVLSARGGKALSLTIYNAGTTEHGMTIGITWWIVGMILAAGYFIFLYRRFTGKIGAGDGHGY
jgi:cytochrome d ubiquinol oxidase subunit II